MVLKALEFTDCLSDSPWFRQNLYEHELSLDIAYKNIKNIETQCRDMIACTKKLSAAQRAFARTLREFKIESVGTTQTDDERVIANCFIEFAKLITQVEDQRERIIEEAETHYIEPLRKFRIERIGRALHDDKKKYEKASNKFYQSLEKHLHLSTIRKHDFREADATLEMEQRHFFQASLDYVCVLQSVHERMNFEVAETLSSFLYSWLTFYHVGHVIHQDFKPFLDSVQVKVQKTKQSFDATQQEAEELKAKMLNHRAQGLASETFTGSSSSIKQGYVLMQEKSKIPKTIGRDVLSRTWTKYYCVYQKETRIFTMIPVSTTSKQGIKGTVGQSVSFKLRGCTRRASDSIDKRFCFDLTTDDRPDVLTFQALSEEDRRQWLDALDGKEPVYSPSTGQLATANLCETTLDATGVDFIMSCIKAIEDKGIREQGLYRNCGVTSKVQKLMQLGLDRRKAEKLNFYDETEWEIKTLSSAVKTFLRNLPEPLMTFDLHTQFINAAKLDDKAERIGHIHYYVYKLPPNHFKMLEIIVRHLRLVADSSSINLMTVGNLGVCFGPTLLRPKEETVAAIMDIKFCNVVVELLIANCDTIFGSKPAHMTGLPCPPKPAHNVPISNVAHLLPQPSPSHSIHSVGSSSDRDHSPSINNSSLRHAHESAPSATSNVINTPPSSSSTRYHRPTRPKMPIYDRTSQINEESQIRATTSAQYTTNILPHLRTNDSSDSLNSIGSVNNTESSPSPNRSSQASVASSTTKQQQPHRGRMSVSYAPAYNSDNVFHKRHSGGNLLAKDNSTYVSCATVPSSSHAAPFVDLSSPSLLSLINPTVSIQPSRRARTLYACAAGHDSELSFSPGQIITNVYESKEHGWLVGTLNGKTGLIPENYIEPLP